MIRWVLLRVLGMALSSTGVVAQSQSPTLPNGEIRQILIDRIDRDRQSVGIVVGLIGSSGRRIIAYGSLDKGDVRPLNGDTIFEIGSVTKVFTSLVLADLAQRGEVALTDPIAKYLPTSVKVPERAGRSIALQDLATHTSGLPRLPTNLVPKDRANPYADYTVEQLYQFLSTYELPRDIGLQYEYSNLGGGLLGHVLERRAGLGYEALVRSRVTGPLGMMDTSIALSENQKARFGVDDIGFHLLDARIPLAPAPKPHTEVPVDPKLFDAYVGRYQLLPNLILTITREGDRLFAQATSQPKLELFAEGEKDYFLRGIDAQLTFVTDAKGVATSVVLHQNGVNLPAKRID
jgi:CubicO group peptidase (beta-lactamase class C family)